ncbi:MAG: ATP-binding cassette domain-containing protein, partial [Planctomycetes bacterium]|nr:ATP-binding cassette domain-containing protein [Planctomycetota bacterium]
MIKPLLCVNNLSRHYQMGEHQVRALDDVSFELFPGDFVSIVGSSGSGKSTMMNILGCLDVPSEGSYILADRVIADTDDDTLSDIRNRHIGFVFQQFNLLHELTVQENIALPLAYQGVPVEERQERARVLAQRFKLEDRLDHKPFELSGGQAQRVAIMRALVTDPDILLLDEPTGALDSKTGREIMDIFHELNNEGLTVIMVTHDNQLAQEASRIIRLSDGRVIEDTRKEDAVDLASGQPAAARRVQQGEKTSLGLSWKDLLRVGIHEGLLAHKLRSALTMLGIIIGVASVIAMSSFSMGSKKKQMMQIRDLGANLINISDDRLEGEKLNEARIKGSRGLSLIDVELLTKQINHIQKVSSYRDTNLRVGVAGKDLNCSVYAVSGAYLEVNNLDLLHGHDLSAQDHIEGRRVAIIGHGVYGELCGDARNNSLAGIAGTANTSNDKNFIDPIGKDIYVGNNPYKVIGVLQNKHINTTELETGGSGNINQLVIVPLATISMRTAYNPMRSEIDSIQVQLDNEDNLDYAGLAIQRLLQGSHNSVKDFSIEVPLDLLKQKQQSQKLLDVLTLCVSSISLLVGGIGIMNIMLASVTERLKEIGIRRAIGATRRDVKMQFLTESVTMSVAGGLIGILVSVVLVL